MTTRRVLSIMFFGLMAACATTDDTGSPSGGGGKADTVGTFCGGFGGIGCEDGLVCVIPDSHPDAGGTCEVACSVEEACPENQECILGADGETGHCEKLKMCGGFANIQCPDGQICKVENTTENGGTDASGVCIDEVFCGGFANVPCPDDGTCVLDDPSVPDGGGHCE